MSTGISECLVFFSSRRRHTRCALVTGVQTCALPICPVSIEDIRDITATRIEIEGLALRRSIERGDAGWEAGIVASLHLLTRATPGLVTDPRLAKPAWVGLDRKSTRLNSSH